MTTVLKCAPHFTGHLPHTAFFQVPPHCTMHPCLALPHAHLLHYVPSHSCSCLPLLFQHPSLHHTPSTDVLCTQLHYTRVSQPVCHGTLVCHQARAGAPGHFWVEPRPLPAAAADTDRRRAWHQPSRGCDSSPRCHPAGRVPPTPL